MGGVVVSEANDRYLKLMERVQQAQPLTAPGPRKFWLARVSSGPLSRSAQVQWHVLPCRGESCDGCE